MAIILTQTDTGAISGVDGGCSSFTPDADADAKRATEGGTPGETELACFLSSASEACLMFETNIGEPNRTKWDAGDYVVRINVTDPDANLTWEDTYVCEIDDTDSFSTVASLTGQATDISSGGVFSHTINRATDYTPKNADSRLYFVLAFKTTLGVGVVKTTPDQNIDTPLAQIVQQAASISASASLGARGTATKFRKAGIKCTATLTVTDFTGDATRQIFRRAGISGSASLGARSTDTHFGRVNISPTANMNIQPTIIRRRGYHHGTRIEKKYHQGPSH